MQLSELVHRIRRGEKEAVKELVAAYGGAVYQRAFERTRDKDLAREAARQTFGQFVAIVQQQPEDDGWALWFGDLIERNISTYAQISADMRTIESELDHEIVTTASVFGTEAGAMPAASEKPKSVQEGDAFIWREEAQKSAPQRKAEAEPLSWRAEQAQAPQRGKKKRKADERAPKSSARKDSIRDEIFDEPYHDKDKGRAGHTVSIILLILVSLVLLWVVAGVAMTLRWIPFFDLGYSWFNQNAFKLF